MLDRPARADRPDEPPRDTGKADRRRLLACLLGEKAFPREWEERLREASTCAGSGAAREGTGDRKSNGNRH